MEHLGLLLAEYTVISTPANYLFKDKKGPHSTGAVQSQKLEMLMEQTIPFHPLKITSCYFKEVFTCCLVYLKGKKGTHD